MEEESEERKLVQSKLPLLTVNGSRSCTSADSSVNSSKPVIQINVSCLYPDDATPHYKSLSVDINTTAREVVSMLVTSNDSCSKNVEHFYLAECIDIEEGNYKRVIPEREKVLLTRQKWKKNREGYFLLVQKNDDLVENSGSPSDKYFATVLSYTSDNESTVSRSRLVNRRHSLPLGKDSRDMFGNEKQNDSYFKRATNHTIPNGTSTSMSRMMTEVAQSSRLQQRRQSWSPASNVISIEPLVCSPSYSAVRIYPEFIFSHAAEVPQLETVTEEYSNENKTTLPVTDEAMKAQKGDSEILDEDESKDEDNLLQVKETEVQAEQPVTIYTAVLKEHYPVRPIKLFVKQPESTPLSETAACTDETESQNKQESDSVISNQLIDLPPQSPDAVTPFSPTASISIDSTEMDMVDSLSSILDEKLNTYGIQSACIDDSSSNELISPKRRASLVNEACSNIQRKRSTPNMTEQPRIENHRSRGSLLKTSHSASVILSPTRREELIEAASEFILRRKSIAEHDEENLILPLQTLDENEKQKDCEDVKTPAFPKIEEANQVSTASTAATQVASEELNEFSPSTSKRFHRNRSARFFSIFNRKVTPTANLEATAAQADSPNLSRGFGFTRSHSVNIKRDKKHPTVNY